jgi:thiosulfate dehydrogenase [quinone] large subunit
VPGARLAGIDRAGGRAAPAPAVPRRHVRLRRRPEAERSGLPAARRADYIGTQLHGFAHGTPGGFLLRAFALPNPRIAGVAVAVAEIVIGVLAVSGLLTRAAAAAGLGLNLVLFATASWGASPYFLGSDIVFVFGWLPLALAGAAGQPALDHLLEAWARRGPPWSKLAGRAARPAPGHETVLTRRAVLAQTLGFAGIASLGIATAASLAKGSYRGSASRNLSATAGAGGSPPAPAHQPAAHARPKRPPRVPANAVELAPSGRLARGTAGTYSDPSTGQPSIVIRDASGSLHAFGAVCPHAGCTVDYQGGQIFCPCHGGTFSARTGAVESGPPPTGLPPRKVVERGGVIYAVPT